MAATIPLSGTIKEALRGLAHRKRFFENCSNSLRTKQQKKY